MPRGQVRQGWPVSVLPRGEVIANKGELMIERGRGRFLPRAAGAAAKPAGLLAPEMDPARNFGAKLLD
jgi:dihydropyrimidinase